MATLITDPDLESRLRAERELSGADRFDEVWEGIYMMSPLADFEHQQIQFKLASAFQSAVGMNSTAIIVAGVNVSDRDEDWQHNYRCPDVAVYLPGTSARDCGTHTLGGPDIAVEILSPYDRAREKIPFYARVGVRELLIVDRDPWAIELYRLDPAAGTLPLVARATLDDPRDIASRLLPLTFRLTPPATAGARPGLLVTQHDSPARWNI